ncbi:MAG: GNAT family N-acetyltransferase [bacterium]|nr:GNAT family N-acetyltransferase [bacterium]
MKFLKATLDDIDQLVQMRVNYLLDDMGYLSELQEKAIREQLPSYYKRHLNKDMYAYLAVDNEKIIATAYLLIHEKPANPNFIQGKIGEVLSVLTLEEYRRQGISKKLLEQLLNDAKQLGLDYVELDATEDGYPLYKQVGFVENISCDVPMKYRILQ